jgi:nicotinate dehydrogenase subunit B
MSDQPLPPSVVNTPRPDRWLRFDPDRTVHLSVGKVEIGQGILTALTQIAAEELDVPPGCVRILSGDTDRAPDEGSTSSSLSIEVSGASVRLISAEVRARFLDRLAQRLNCAPAELSVADGGFLRGGTPTGQDYWSFAPEIDLTQPATGRAPPKPRAAYRLVGKALPRVDLPAKLSGAAFVHDLAPPGMLHARMLRQPGRGAQLAALDEAAIRRAAGGDIRIVRQGNFVAIVSEDETVAHRAAIAAPAHAKWEDVAAIPPGADEARAFVGQSADDRLSGAPMPTAPPTGPVVEATYSRPYIAHASLGPSCALAEERDGHLTVWTHSQAVYPLRNSLSNILGRPIETISVRHGQGAGCYGHNGADDAALDAALVAQLVPGRPIRVQWRREEEFGFEPVGTAQVVTLRAVLDAKGRPADWTAEIWAGSHVQRPASGGNMLAHEALPTPPPDPRPFEPPEASGGGGVRNAVPMYDIPATRIVHHLARRTPIRTSSLRSLGALANVFALECFLDELAERAGEDPLAYRLSILSNPRARAVIERASAMANWAGRGAAGTGRGLGLGFGQYKNRSAYAAVVAEVEVEREVRLRRVWCAADGGLIISPDGARNQLEGGIVQAASMTLKEQVRFDRQGIRSLDWESYPILRFSEVPEIAVELMDRPDQPSLGMGECTIGPTAAAIGNAVAHALGARIRDLPLTRERIAAALAVG